MLDGHSNGNGPRIQLIHGEVVIEQELDDDGRAGRWRRLILTIPLARGRRRHDVVVVRHWPARQPPDGRSGRGGAVARRHVGRGGRADGRREAGRQR